MGYTPLLSLAAVAMLVVAGPVHAEPKQGQGQDQGQSQGKAQGQGKSQAQGPEQAQYRSEGPPRDDRDNGKGDKDKGEKKMTHGQVVSECNHRANERKLQGKDRQHFVEWCTERGERYKFDDRRYSYDRDCYQKADRKGLSGTARMAFVADCGAKRDRDYERERERDRKQEIEYDPRGRDVLDRNEQKK